MSDSDTKMETITSPLKRGGSPLTANTNGNTLFEDSSSKKVKLDASTGADSPRVDAREPYRKGRAPIKKEYLVYEETDLLPIADDDAAESKPQSTYRLDNRDINPRPPKMSKADKDARKGQNKRRKFAKVGEARALCRTRIMFNEFSPEYCSFGDRCKGEHDLRGYYEARDNFEDGMCPVWESKGWCGSGWRCKWVKSHMEEVATEVPVSEGSEEKVTRMELRLVTDEIKRQLVNERDGGEAIENEAPKDVKMQLTKKKYNYERSEPYLVYLDSIKEPDAVKKPRDANGKVILDEEAERRDNAAAYVEPPFKACEKRKIHIDASTPLLAPLTTTGNLPFRRLCASFGASVTYSEMAMSIPLLNGTNGEWALIRSHPIEKHFGAQISANKYWQCIKAAEVLANVCPSLNVIDLNAGCPIDLVFRSGGGSGLLQHPSKISKMLKGMNAVSQDIPITVKIRMGCQDAHPTADKVIKRVIDEGDVAAITLHGRSRQQRYSRAADWEYIHQMSTMITSMKNYRALRTDASSADAEKPEGRLVPYFIGNGDCYSYVDYYDAIENAKVDSVMLARGALIKPWIFEEISSRQYLDKSATERLDMVKDYARNGLDYWGSDEWGVNQTRRFLCEYLSFTYRYVPIGLLEYLPPNLQDRPPRWRGRNQLETLLGSPDYKDWIKISEMFLGKCSEGFDFVPKHKSNAYEAGNMEAEG